MLYRVWVSRRHGRPVYQCARVALACELSEVEALLLSDPSVDELAVEEMDEGGEA